MRGPGTLLNVAAFGDELAGAVGRSAPLLVLGAYRRRAARRSGAAGGQVAAGRLRHAAFASYLGWGVAASGLAVLAYQGGLTALAAVLDQVMTPVVVAAMTGVGGLLVLAIGLRLLGLARVRVANLRPAVLLAPLPPAWSRRSDSANRRAATAILEERTPTTPANEGGRQ